MFKEMSKLHIKKGDTVYVNSGESKGKQGRVLRVLVKDQNGKLVRYAKKSGEVIK